MTKTPERIWAYLFTGRSGEGKWYSFDPRAYVGECPEYIRADRIEALVAAERDDLVKAHRQGYAQGSAAGETLRKAMVDRIEELEAEKESKPILTPSMDDLVTQLGGHAALERRDARIRNEALREALVNLRTYAPHLVDGPEHDVGYYHGYQTALNRVLALTENQSDD